MSQPVKLTADPKQTGDDCPLSVTHQHWNIGCFAVYWATYYLTAPVSYIGLTHANLLKGLGNNDTVSNLPLAMYLWLAVVPVLMAWFFPQPRYLKPLALLSIGMMAAITAAVALALWSGAPSWAATWTVVAHGAVFGVANGVVITVLWDLLRRGVSTSRRGKALGFAFGVGPLFACVGRWCRMRCWTADCWGGARSVWRFPTTTWPCSPPLPRCFSWRPPAWPPSACPQAHGPADAQRTPLKEIVAGLRQFVQNRAVLFTVAIYILVFSGGSAIFANVSLHAQDVLGEQADTLGLQSFLRFGCKAAAGAALGWLLAAASPRATLFATTSILLTGIGWALTSTGWWFMLTFGLLARASCSARTS